jgi:hypothetical protein
MRKLIRLMAGIVVFGAVLAAAPGPASADHDLGTPAGSNVPAPATGKGVAGDVTNGWHEEAPNLKVAGLEVLCQVTGTVLGGDPPTPSAGHNPFPPAGIDDPAHSHFNFLNTVITCTDSTLDPVIADGGNDGHVLPWPPPQPPPPGAPELELPEARAPVCTDQHPVGASNGAHHGSMTESGWSHSSDYSGGSSNTCVVPGTPQHDGGNTGDCKAGNNQNKADITITRVGVGTAGGAPNFVKYYRLGNVVYFWGCNNILAPARRFSGVLVIAPDPRTQTGAHAFPLCLVPGGAGCDLLLAGVSVRSAAWLL